MKKQIVFTLVDGTFSPAEGKEILTQLFNDKLNYHKVKDFAAHLRTGEEHDFSVRRIAELQTDRANIEALPDVSETGQKKLKISGEIKIEWVD
jgi:hypothetical protein